MKRKNHYIFILFIAIIVVITLRLQDNPVIIIEDDSALGQTTTTTIPIHLEHDPLQNLSFSNDVNITKIKTYDNRYIAIGEENNTPYLQTIQSTSEDTLTKGNPYLIHGMTGTVTDITNYDYYLSATINNQTAYDLIHYGDDFIPFHKKQIRYNYSKGITINPQYLVIHETANYAEGADAEAHYRYWNNNPTAYASTHFVVDNHEIYQMLELNQSAWHVGDNDGHSNITNLNSIGIEIAVNKDGNYVKARQNAIDLTIQLMKALDMDISQLKTHNDASGKNCPTTMLTNGTLWQNFVEQVQTGLNNA